MNNKKYLFFLVFMGIFCTLRDAIEASQPSTQTASQELTTPDTATPEKKQSVSNSTTLRRTRRHKKTVHTDSTVDQVDTNQCPHEDTPVEKLTAQQLEEVLVCAQAQQDKLDAQVEKLEELIEKAEIKENLQPAKKSMFNFFSGPRCPYSNTPLKNLKAEQLEEIYAYTQTNTMDAAFTIDLLERLIALSDNHAGVKQYKLQLADTHYNVHHIEKAAACYEDFGVMYPGSNENEYVLYKAVVCMFELSLDADRDQTNTKKTIVLVKEFLKHAKKSELIQEAHDILQNCYTRLYDHEVYVMNFYAKKKNFVAAQMRLDYIEKSFTETIPGIEGKIADLKTQLELRKNPVKPTRKTVVKKLLA